MARWLRALAAVPEDQASSPTFTMGGGPELFVIPTLRDLMSSSGR